MKKLIIASVVAIFAMGIAMSAYAANPGDVSATTQASVSVGQIFTIALATGTAGGRSGQNAITFHAIDGSSAGGWYYNNLATLNANGDPNDGKSDIGIIVVSNAHDGTNHYYVKIKKASDGLDGKLGFGVGGAYDAGAAVQTNADGTVTYPSGWQGSTGTGSSGWGALLATNTTVYTSGTNVYIPKGVLIPISYALVPTGLTQTTYNTTFTYTLTMTA